MCERQNERENKERNKVSERERANRRASKYKVNMGKFHVILDDERHSKTNDGERRLGKNVEVLV